MKKFEIPTIEIDNITVTDVITASGCVGYEACSEETALG